MVTDSMQIKANLHTPPLVGQQYCNQQKTREVMGEGPGRTRHLDNGEKQEKDTIVLLHPLTLHWSAMWEERPDVHLGKSINLLLIYPVLMGRGI